MTFTKLMSDILQCAPQAALTVESHQSKSFWQPVPIAPHNFTLLIPLELYLSRTSPNP